MIAERGMKQRRFAENTKAAIWRALRTKPRIRFWMKKFSFWASHHLNQRSCGSEPKKKRRSERHTIGQMDASSSEWTLLLTFLRVCVWGGGGGRGWGSMEIDNFGGRNQLTNFRNLGIAPWYNWTPLIAENFIQRPKIGAALADKIQLDQKHTTIARKKKLHHVGHFSRHLGQPWFSEIFAISVTTLVNLGSLNYLPDLHVHMMFQGCPRTSFDFKGRSG